MKHQHEGQDAPPSFWSSRFAIGLLVIGSVAAYFLLTEHLAHVFGALPFLLLMACLLMHVFMHGGHSHHHGHNHSENPDTAEPRKPKEPS